MSSPTIRKASWLAISGIAAATGLAIILLAHALEPTLLVKNSAGNIVGILPRHTIWVVVEHIASALLILSLWHIADHWFLRREAQSELLNYIKKVYGEAELTRDANEIGVTALYRNSHVFNWEDTVTKSKNLILVFGSGAGWVARYAEVLADRMADQSKATEIFLVHPQSPMVGVIADKLKISRARYANQILGTVEQLKQMGANPSNSKVYGHFSSDCHSLCIADNEGFLTLRYFTSRSRNAPVLRFVGGKEGCFLVRIVSDIEELKKHSRPLLS